MVLINNRPAGHIHVVQGISACLGLRFSLRRPNPDT